MTSDIHLPLAEESVLSTLNADGSRRWMMPRPAAGRLWRARCVVAWVLIILFAVLPWLRIGGFPPILLDVMSRKFIFFGAVFRPTDTLLLALLLLAIFTAVFLLTAIVGRVWCGWGCPQTIYMEFVYRPLERLFMGRAWGRKDARVPAWRVGLMYGSFLLVSAHLANTFLAYFVGTDQLVAWTIGTPAKHPTAFAVFAATTALMLFDFGYFREQLCTLVCPYGRFQSVLLDQDSLIVGYDAKRGEPRGRRSSVAPNDSAGDCVDCSMCVQVCPTGIDIRNGLQMECINCTQCIDACNAVMSKIKRPPGLIRYSSQKRLAGAAPRRFRARLVVYPFLLIAFVTSLIILLAQRSDMAVVQVRTPGITDRALENGAIESPLRLRIDNRTDTSRQYDIRAIDDGVALESPEARTSRTRAASDAPPSIQVAPYESGTIELLVRAARESFSRGRREITVQVTDDRGQIELLRCVVLGPMDAGTGGTR